mgnify:CR=1 FL=1
MSYLAAFTAQAVAAALKRTLAEMDDTGAATPRTTFKKKRKEKRALHEQAIQEQKARDEAILKVSDTYRDLREHEKALAWAERAALRSS